MEKTLQEQFLNSARKNKTHLMVILTNGFQQRGTVISFDGYTVLLEYDGKQYLIFKHAISTIVPQRQVLLNAE